MIINKLKPTIRIDFSLWVRINYICNILKAAAAILLSVLFTVQVSLPNMDLCCEFQKLPALYDHFQEHKAIDGLSVFEFLGLHYGTGKIAQDHHHDDQHDSKLPFSKEHHCSHSISFITVIPLADIGEQIFSYSDDQGCHYSFSISSALQDSPFQPPQEVA